MDWVVALQQLVDAAKAGKKLSALIQRQLGQWITALPNYIKAYIPNFLFSHHDKSCPSISVGFGKIRPLCASKYDAFAMFVVKKYGQNVVMQAVR
jgi:hypothetical protein